MDIDSLKQVGHRFGTGAFDVAEVFSPRPVGNRRMRIVATLDPKIDRATLTAVCDFWAPGVKVMGIHELVANAMVLEGENKRELNLRLQPVAEEE